MIILLDKLEELEKEHGMLGAIVGVLILAVSLMTSFGILYLLVRFNLELFNWVVNRLWFS